MSNYQRLISYIYTYEGGIKGKNIGFVKMETRNAQCRITVNVKKIFVGGNPLGVFLLSNQGELQIGTLFARNGAGEFRAAVNPDNIEDSGRSMEEFYGLSVHDVESAWRAYTTIWEDAVAHAAEVELAEVTSEKLQKKQTQEKTMVIHNVTQLPISKEIEKDLELEEKLDEKLEAEERAEVHRREHWKRDGIGVRESLIESPNAVLNRSPQNQMRTLEMMPPGEKMSPGEMMPPGEKMSPGEKMPVEEKMPVGEKMSPGVMTSPMIAEPGIPQHTVSGPEIPQPRMPGAEIMQPKEPEVEIILPEAPKPESTQPIYHMMPEPPQPQHMPPQPQHMPPQPQHMPPQPTQPPQPPQAEPQLRQPHTPGAELAQPKASEPEEREREPMPYVPVSRDESEIKNHQEMWDYLRKKCGKILAFDYADGCEILTIKPQDIGLLPRDNWVFGNNSFLLHGYYNFRYLILARLENPTGMPRYILGIPGNYFSNEKYMAAMFGFPDFVLSKTQSTSEGRFGYWYADIKIGE